MSYSYSAASPEFTALCQSQMTLLKQGLGAVWSAVYLAEEFRESQQTRLVPFAIYPQTEKNWRQNFPSLRLPEVWQTHSLHRTWSLVRGSQAGEATISPQDAARTCQAPLSANEWASYESESNIPFEKQDALTADTSLGENSSVPRTRLVSFPDTGQKYQSFSLNALLLPEMINSDTPDNGEAGKEYLREQQLIFPLIYEDLVMGLLMIGRNEQEWAEPELNQIEEIARTIALACFLDRRNSWYKKQLKRQQEQRRREQDKLDVLLHQLRNPLTALRTFGKLLLRRFLPEDRNHSVANSILRESDRLQELLQQFEADLKQQDLDNPPVTLSADSVRLSEQDLANYNGNFLLPSNYVATEVVDLEQILEPLLLSAEAIATERNIKIMAEIPHHLPKVSANGKALREVVNNLIDNALKYTPAGGKVKISIEKSDSQNRLGIAVSDTGYGIPQPDQQRIFERHYRGVQAESDIAGSGLGLAIAQELVEQMQGSIELISPNNLAQNQDCPGTTFIVWLPISAVKAQSSG